MPARIGTISSQKWQSIINAEAKVCSAKTIKNAWGFLASVIHEATGKAISVRLPQLVEADRPFLEPDQIHTFVAAVHGDSVEVSALLALSSLRQSEIMGLQWEDVDLEKGVLWVRGAAVPDEHNKLIRKTETKNQTSRRQVPIIAPLAVALRACPPKASGPVVTIGTSWMYKRINQICKANGLPQIGVHGLRHPYVKHTTKNKATFRSDSTGSRFMYYRHITALSKISKPE